MNIDINQRNHSISELKQQDIQGFTRTLSITERFHVLEEICRKHGKQPHIHYDGSGFEIMDATKKFMERRGSHSRKLSKKAMEYMTILGIKE